MNRFSTAFAAALVIAFSVRATETAASPSAAKPVGKSADKPTEKSAQIRLTPGAPLPSPELVATLAEKDRQLFDAVFGCKLDALAGLIADDFEFLHDKHGLTADSGAKFMDGMRANCERQKTGENFRARRELIEGAMTVHVLNQYGAMQIGEHRSYALQPGQPDRLTETGKFIDVWRQMDGEWKLARVISYGHALAE
jgi:hypothetical protein